MKWHLYFQIIDMAFFFIILLVFIGSYGIAAHAIMYPNSPGEAQLFVDIFRKPYWQMYGELFLEELEGTISI